jgi:hypothetical protein
MKLYDLLQFSVCVFSILAAGSWLQSATKGNGRRSRADQSASDEWEDELRRAH